jgi:hypothetical protein
LPEEVTARVRAYLVGQAESKGFAELREPVEEARAALLAEVQDVSAVQAAFKPGGEGEAGWSILEALRHVVFEEEELTRQIVALAHGQAAEGTEIGRLRRREDADLTALLGDLRAVRTELLLKVEEVAGNERLDTTAPHPWFRDLNCRAWFLFQRVHDGDHTRQIQAIKRAPGYPA